MIDEATIQSAKDVDINKILDNFSWERCRNNINMMHCPSPEHRDSSPSCSYNKRNNTVHCFGCGKTFDTIGLYQALCEKVDGRRVTFPRAVAEVLILDDMEISSIQSGTASTGSKTSSSNNIFSSVVNNSRPLTGYELNYLHERGIMLYDSYVYEGKIYTKH